MQHALAIPVRALEVFSSVPPGHLVMLETRETNGPHIRPGEFAVVDLADREPVSGELFLIHWSTGGRSIMQTNFRRAFGAGPFWMMDPLNRPSDEFGLYERIQRRQEVFLSDGPITEEGLRQKTVGRVVGIYQAPEPQRLLATTAKRAA